MRFRACLVFGFRVALSIFALGVFDAARCLAGDNGFRTDLMVPSGEGECAGAPACQSVKFPAVTVPAGRRVSTRVSCPAERPHLWGWDAAQHEHVRVELVAAERRSAILDGVNQADVPGQFVVSLGCSTQPYTGTQLVKSRAFVPTKTLAPREEPPASTPPAAAEAGNACTDLNVPNCNLQQQIGFFIWGSHTGERNFTCAGEYPYAWNYTYVNAGPHGLPTSTGIVSGEYPGTMDVLFTNWSVYKTGTITVTLACSKNNPFGGTCGGPVNDPKCPVVSGSYRHNCTSAGGVPVCIGFWQERCAANNQLFSCTNTEVFDWCQPCTG